MTLSKRHSEGDNAKDLTAFFAAHPILLAPMAGVSDVVFRQICLEFGASLTYTEMVSAKGLSYGNQKTQDLIQIAPNEDKAAVQLFGNEPKVLADEARAIQDMLGDRLAYLDINMGCPARKIVKKGDGCALMKDPPLAAEIVKTVSSSIEIPLTVKFRRGYECEHETAVDFAKRMEEAGASAVAVHGRYAEQLYRGKADWQVIARVKDAVDIPVIGNGDITCGERARAMIKETNCDAVMIGRAAQGNPWIFTQVRAALQNELIPEAPSIAERIELARRHVSCFAQKNTEKSLPRMRKHAAWYLSGLPGASVARGKLQECSTLDDFNAVFDELMNYTQESLQKGEGDV